MNIFDRISILGVRLQFTNDLPEHWLGCYLDDSRLILVRNNLTVAEETETIHHEYVHAFHRDRSSEHLTETRADRTAAKMLITRADYARAEQINPNPIAIARELGRTLHMVRVYCTMLENNQTLAAS
jgi:hypothetical protein